jgi:hypothetical protein
VNDAQDWGAGFGYTVATGRLWCPVDEFHRRAETLLGRPIFTSEFGREDVWAEMRAALEQEAMNLA